MHGEELVVGLGRDEEAVGSEQVDANHGGENAAESEEEGDAREIEPGNAFVVGGKQPRADTVGGI